MSTSYYAPREGYRLEDNSASVGRSLWHLVSVTDGWAATFDGQHLHLAFDRCRKVAEQFRGRILMRPDAAGLPDTEWVVSEYGEPVTVGDLRRGVAP